MDDKTFAVPRLSIGAAFRIVTEVGAKGNAVQTVLNALILADKEIHNNTRPIAPSKTVVSREYLEGLESIIPWLLGEAGEFPDRKPKEGAYYWRKELRSRWYRLQEQFPERKATP